MIEGLNVPRGTVLTSGLWNEAERRRAALRIVQAPGYRVQVMADGTALHFDGVDLGHAWRTSGGPEAVMIAPGLVNSMHEAVIGGVPLSRGGELELRGGDFDEDGRTWIGLRCELERRDDRVLATLAEGTAPEVRAVNMPPRRLPPERGVLWHGLAMVEAEGGRVWQIAEHNLRIRTAGARAWMEVDV